MVRAAVGLGSNLGDRLGLLRLGLDGLGQVGSVLAVSSLFETAPVGGPDQGPFLNAVALVETALSPEELLAGLHGIEAAAGRVRQERWGPRSLDLDLLVYDEVVRDFPDPVVPHPRAHERRFVLAPLVEVWPDANLRSGPARVALAQVAPQRIRRVAAEWADGVPRFLERGGAWVAAQVLGLVAWAVAFVTTAGFPPRAWMWPGLLPMALGVWMALAAVPMLGPGFTPFPAPSQSGRLTTAGPYARVRHPMYGGIFLLVLGTSILGGSWPGIGAALILGVFFHLKALHEERFLTIAYPGYDEYSRAVPRRLVPGIF